jgi:ABC-2 type transport system ATP-binding protein
LAFAAGDRGHAGEGVVSLAGVALVRESFDDGPGYRWRQDRTTGCDGAEGAAAIGVGHARVDELLELLDLAAAGRRRVGGYSLGMRQRLGLAGALLADPPALLLDEPATGLDPDGIRWLRGLLRGLAAEGRTVPLSSHLLGEVAQTVDRVILLNGGRLVADDRVDHLITGARGDVFVRTPDVARLASAVARAGWTSRPAGPDALVVSGAASPDELGLVAVHAHAPVLELRLESDASKRPSSR